MELSDLTKYAKEKYHIKEEFKWTDFPGFSVLSHPRTGKWVALLMRQWDYESGTEIQRCDIKCGRQCISEFQVPYVTNAFRMKGNKWVGVIFDDRTDPENPVVTDDVVYMTADEEDNYHVAQANAELDEEGHFIHRNVSGRYRAETSSYPKRLFEYMDVSPKMVFSVATSLIPFLENDDANRALMGSNMQRQAVPLLTTESPVVGTGMEIKAAEDSGVCVLAPRSGVVDFVDATMIRLKYDDGETEELHLQKFQRSNQSNCYNQRPIVSMGERVSEGQVIADGPSTAGGELGLGKNPLIGFMTWEGYNYEDAVLISERLVRDDVYTSVHIEEYECEARDTKLGPEEITRDVPGVGEEALKDLDEEGIIRIGAEVRAGDILVGKVTPKGETELTAEERLLRAIFGEKAREVRDTSLKVPHGEFGIIVDTKVFSRANGDELHRRERSRSATRWRAATATRVSYPASCRWKTCLTCRTADRSTSC